MKKTNKKQQKEPEKIALEEVTPVQNISEEHPAKQPTQASANKPDNKPEQIQKMTPDKPIATKPVQLGKRKHIVQKGDTLYKLARFYYGDQKYWKKIWLANKDIIPNPNKIKEGQELIIP